jgi:hypothetical protein
MGLHYTTNMGFVGSGKYGCGKWENLVWKGAGKISFMNVPPDFMNDPSDTNIPSDTNDPSDTNIPSDTNDPSDTNIPSDTNVPADTIFSSDTNVWNPVNMS